MSNSKVDYLEIGIGLFAALQNCTNNRSMFIGRDIIFVGTGGVFDDFKKPELYLIDEVSWLPLCERLGISYQVPTMPKIALKPLNEHRNLKRAGAICSGNITKTDHPNYFTETKTYIENIELYSCALAAKDVCKSFTALLASTNKVGPESHAQWKANYIEAASITEHYLKKSIAGT